GFAVLAPEIHLAAPVAVDEEPPELLARDLGSPDDEDFDRQAEELRTRVSEEPRRRLVRVDVAALLVADERRVGDPVEQVDRPYARNRCEFLLDHPMLPPAEPAHECRKAYAQGLGPGSETLPHPAVDGRLSDTAKTRHLPGTPRPRQQEVATRPWRGARPRPRGDPGRPPRSSP